MKRTILITGGILNLLLAVMHIMFWQMLGWPESLTGTSTDNSAILQIANVIIIFVLLYFTVMSFILIKDEFKSVSAKSIPVLIAGFYIIRLVLGYPFFGYSGEELIIWIVCGLIAAGYSALLFLESPGK